MWNVAHPHPQLVHEGKLTMYMGVKGPQFICGERRVAKVIEAKTKTENKKKLSISSYVRSVTMAIVSINV